MALSGEPGEDGLRRRETARLARGDAELDERYQPPVGAAPFRVHVDPEAAVRALAGEQVADTRAAEDQRGLRWGLNAEKIALRLPDDPRLVRPEQPIDGRDRDAPPRLLRIRREERCDPGPSGSTVTTRRRLACRPADSRPRRFGTIDGLAWVMPRLLTLSICGHSSERRRAARAPPAVRSLVALAVRRACRRRSRPGP